MDPGRPVGADFDRGAGWFIIPKDPFAAAAGDGDARDAETALALGILPFPPHNFHTRHAKRIMASLDDLEMQRVRPFERLCFVMYVVLYMIFVFLALSFVKLLTGSQ